MANELKMAQHQAIIGLWQQGWSHRRIAAELDIDRETVSRHIKAAVRAAAAVVSGLETGPPGEGPANATISITGSTGPATGGSTGPLDGQSNSTGVEPGAPPSVGEPNAAISIAGSTGLAAGGSTGLATAGVTLAVGELAGPSTGTADVFAADYAARLSSDAAAAIGSAAPVPAAEGSAGRRSLCEPLRAVIVAALDLGLTARRIWQDLKADHGFNGDYQSVQRFVRGLRDASPLPFRRMECEPGAEAQIDFGKGAPIVTADGKRTRPHLFRIVLSHSRKAYSEVVPRQTTESFLRCLENAFRHFGGVPRTLVPDNLKAAVLHADWYDPELNPKIAAFCAYYGTVLLPTRPRTPRHKGKVERGVDYAQSNAVKGRTFSSLAEQNAFLQEWEANIADTRIHGTTRKQVGRAFLEAEKPALLPLPAGRFPSFQEAQRIVSRDGHAEVAKAYYSAPPEFVGRTIWARWDGHTVRLFDQQMRQIAIHVQREPGRFNTDAKHIAPEKRAGVERGAAPWLKSAHAIGAHAGQWARDLLQQRGIHGLRAVMGLVSLTKKHPAHAVDQACRVACSHGAHRLRDVRNLLKRAEPAQEQQMLPFVEEHPVIRPLTEYGKLIQAAFDRTPVAPSNR
jgi:transposase